MNRRKFLIAVGAVPVAVYFAELPTPAAASAPLLDTWYTKLYPWQQHLWAQLESGKQVMYVTSTQRAAWDTFNLFKRHKNLFTTHIGAGISGRGADLIIMDEFTDYETHASSVMRARYKDWFNQTIRTRLHRDGKIKWVFT